MKGKPSGFPFFVSVLGWPDTCYMQDGYAKCGGPEQRRKSHRQSRILQSYDENLIQHRCEGLWEVIIAPPPALSPSSFAESRTKKGRGTLPFFVFASDLAHLSQYAIQPCQVCKTRRSHPAPTRCACTCSCRRAGTSPTAPASRGANDL